MLEKIQHIEGLEGYQDHELYDDTNPVDLQVRFMLVSEEMTFLTEQTGSLVMKNFVYIRKEKNLGRTMMQRRIRDVVVFDEANQKWRVTKLAKDSDIRKYPDEWNAFATGSVAEVVGTPLSILFKLDPSKVQTYKNSHIVTIEQLAAQNDDNTQSLGMGAREDVNKAKRYLERVKENASGIQISAKLAEKDSKIQALQTELDQFKAQFSAFIANQQSGGESEQVTVRKSPGRPRKPIVSDQIATGA